MLMGAVRPDAIDLKAGSGPVSTTRLTACLWIGSYVMCFANGGALIEKVLPASEASTFGSEHQHAVSSGIFLSSEASGNRVAVADAEEARRQAESRVLEASIAFKKIVGDVAHAEAKIRLQAAGKIDDIKKNASMSVRRVEHRAAEIEATARAAAYEAHQDVAVNEAEVERKVTAAAAEADFEANGNAAAEIQHLKANPWERDIVLWREREAIASNLMKDAQAWSCTWMIMLCASILAAIAATCVLCTTNRQLEHRRSYHTKTIVKIRQEVIQSQRQIRDLGNPLLNGAILSPSVRPHSPNSSGSLSPNSLTSPVVRDSRKTNCE